MTIMSTKTYDEALDFMPTSTTGGRGPWATAKTIFSALREGLDARGRYQDNVARGMQPSEAAGKAFGQYQHKL
jgi:hypothetical protein